ncbi:MAG: DinB family protein [Gemmatimonadales bacterium]
MTMTATPTTTGEIEAFRHQARVIDAVVRLNVAGVTHQESLTQPSPGGNCLNWVLGHLVATQENALRLLGQETVFPAGALKRYDRAGDPIRGDAPDVRNFSDLLAAWETSAPRLDAGLAALDPATFDQPAPFSPTNDPNETVRTLVVTILFHQAYHAGQAGVLRRISGKAGAIK